MIQANRKAASRVCPWGVGIASRTSRRRLTIQPLEPRCPMDATGIAGGFGHIAINAGDSLWENASVPAITCFPEEALRSPHTHGKHDGREGSLDAPHPGADADQALKPSTDDQVTPVDAPVQLTDEDSDREFSETAEPNSSTVTDPPQHPSGGTLLEPQFRPEPVRFDSAQGPIGTIGLMAHARRDDDAVSGIQTIHNRDARASDLAAGMDSAASYRRSEVSLSKTRYYAPAEGHSDNGDAALDHHSISLRPFLRSSMSQQAGIAIDGSDSHRLTHWKSASGPADQQPTAAPSCVAIAQRQTDLAIVALVSTFPEVDVAPLGDIGCGQAITPTVTPRHERDEAILVAGECDGDNAMVAANDPHPRACDFIANLSHWAALGLLLSHRIRGGMSIGRIGGRLSRAGR